MVYVSNGSQVAGGGNVIRVDPTVASDEAAAPACDPVVVPGADFDDVGGNIHREAIDCVAAYGLMQGLADGTFGVAAPITRGQAASIVVRILSRTDVQVPEDPPDAFSDDDGNAHEHNIDVLAALGILQGSDGEVHPNDSISRAAGAALLARAYEEIAGEPLPPGPDAFTDDDGTVLEDAINAVAAAGWVNGTGPDTFNPSGNATRSQVASIVARVLGTLVTEGLMETLPAG
jgi:hypothetical protein